MRMTVCTSGEALRSAVASAGWTWHAAVAGGPTRLTSPNGGVAWLVEDGNVATVWLPDEGHAAERETLESALDQLEPREPSEEDRPLLRRLRRIEGQLRGLQRMIEARRECEPILTQFAAVTSALKQAAAQLVTSHLIHCVREEIESGGDPAELNRRLLNVLF